MRRSEWFDQLARQMVAMLPRRHLPFLEAITALGSDASAANVALLGRGTLIAQICTDYNNAFSANHVAVRLRAAQLCPRDSTLVEVLDEFVRPTFEAFRRGRLPLDQWWSAEAHFFVLMPWYARCRLADIGVDKMGEELGNLWGLSDTSLTFFLDEAQLPLPSVPSSLKDPGSDSALAGIWERSDIQALLAAEIAKFPARLFIHDEMREAVVAAARLRINTRQREAFQDVVREPESLRDELEQGLRCLTAYELSLIREPSEDHRLLAASVDALQNVSFLSAVGANAVADGRLDQLLVPDWLTEYLVSAGGRIGHRSCGPIPYWFVALESTDIPEEVSSGSALEGLGLANVEPSSGLAEFALPFEIRGEQRVASFHFSDSVADGMELALIAVTGTIRIDLFLLGRDGLLDLIHSAQYKVADSPLGDSARNAALRKLRSIPSDPDGLLNAWFQEHAEDNAVNGFLASDWAKDEELVSLHAPHEAHEADAALIAGLVAARERWLSLQDLLAAKQVESLGHDALKHQVAMAHSDYTFALGSVRRRPDKEPEPVRLAELVAGLVDQHRAFVHLNRSNDYLDAFICVDNGDGPTVSRLDVSGTPLLDVERSLADWRDGEPVSLTRVMDRVGTDLGQAIASHLGDTAVSHLFMSPIGFLHAIPMSRLHLAKGGVLGDLFSISYAPSARLLQPLRAGTGRNPGNRLVSAAYHEDDDIPLASVEIALIGALYDDVTVLAGAAATPDAVIAAARNASVLHAACHGTWRFGDGYASGLHLAGESPASGYLSVARLHRDADLDDVELVFLSACDTGRASATWPAIQNYLGIDGAFLACGAKTVVSSLWEVDDLAGLLFSFEFYRHLVKQASPHTAFDEATDFLRSGRYERLDEGEAHVKHLDTHWPAWREAISEVGAEFTDPYYWAVFKLSGLLGTG